MKEIDKKKVKTDSITDLINNEKNILKRLNHPFIGKFFGSFQTDASLYFVMEYIRGGDLRNFMDHKGKFTEEWTKLYIAELVLALEYLHSNKIIYRDMKPNNIMVDDNLHIKLIDFGLSKIMISEYAGTLCGTPAYIAPEVITSTSYTIAADWWSLVKMLLTLGNTNV